MELLIKFKSELLAFALKEFLQEIFGSQTKVTISLCESEKPEKVVTTDIGEDLILILDCFSLREMNSEHLLLCKKILIDTGLSEQELAFYINHYQVNGVFLTNSNPELIKECIEAVATNRTWLPKEYIKESLQNQNFILSLTKREREIILLLCEGLSNKEIASKLSLAEQTVKIYVGRVLKKAGVKNRSSLIKVLLTCYPTLFSQFSQQPETKSHSDRKKIKLIKKSQSKSK